MCKIRIIFKRDNDKIIKDEIYQFDNLEISPIDRPSYITCMIGDGQKSFTASFINDEESFCEIVVDETLQYMYGKLSGRIKELLTTQEKLYDTTLFRCKNLLPSDLTTRVSNNINEYLKLYALILEKLESSLYYEAER